MAEADVDTCAVCLSSISGDTEAFLDNCYHRFHLEVGLTDLPNTEFQQLFS